MAPFSPSCCAIGRFQMEPVSMVASVFTLVAAVGRVGQGLEKVCCLVRYFEAPGELASLTNEISEWKVLLDGARDAASSLDEDARAFPGIVGRGDDVREISNRAKKYLYKLDTLIEYKLRSSEGLDKNGKPYVSRLLLCGKQRKLRSLLQHLRDCRSCLNVALHTATISQTHSREKHRLGSMLHIQDICVANGEKTTQLSSEMTRRTDCLEYKVDQLLKSARLPAPPGTTPQPLPVPSLAITVEGHPETSSFQEGATPQMLCTSLAAGPQAMLCVKASIGRKECARFCRCRCHVRTQLSTPRWTKSVLGTLFGSFTGCPIPGIRACNYSRCRQAGASSIQVLYMFPAWFVQWAVVFSTTWTGLSGPGASWTFRMPRLRCDSAIIWFYVRRGSLCDVRKCLESGTASPYDINSSGLTLLYWSIVVHQPKISYLLLENGADVHSSDHYGKSPTLEALERLLQMDSGSRLTSPWRPLVPDMEYALESLNLNVLHRIILRMAPIGLEEYLDCDNSSIDTPDSRGWTPLHLAVVENSVKAVRILLERGATLGKRNCGGDTPLRLAAKYGHLECAEVLLERGALVNVAGAHDWSPLHCVALTQETWRSQALAELLISHGANVFAVDHFHRTPLLAASIFNRFQLARTLLAHGADTDTCDGHGKSPIMVGVRESSTSVVELLLERGARLDGEDLSGRNILHSTALHGDRQIMNILLHANLEGIDAHALDKDGNTPLDCFIHHRANFVPRPVEGSTDEDERRAFKALLARAGSSRVEEMYEERSRGGDDGDEDSDEKDSARSSSYDSFTDDDDHVKGGSPSDSRSDTPTQHPDLEEDIFFDAEETLPSP